MILKIGTRTDKLFADVSLLINQFNTTARLSISYKNDIKFIFLILQKARSLIKILSKWRLLRKTRRCLNTI